MRFYPMALAVAETPGEDGRREFAYLVRGLGEGTPYRLLIGNPAGDVTDERVTGGPCGAALFYAGGAWEGWMHLGWTVEPSDPRGFYSVELRSGDGQRVLAAASFTAN